MKNNEVENAICYIRDYIQWYNERSASAVARKLMDAVNVVIENYKTEEKRVSDLENFGVMRDLFIGLAFDKYLENIDVREAARVPIQYYIKRISENYLFLKDVNARFYYAYKDYKECERAKKMLQDELEFKVGLVNELERAKKEGLNKIRQQIERMIKESDGCIEDFRELVRKYG